MKAIKLTTQGDCEGHTSRICGYFKGSKEQIISYCIKNSIDPYYNFTMDEINIIDVSNIETNLKVNIDKYGTPSYQISQEMENERIRLKALSKLTIKEKQLLGL